MSTLHINGATESVNNKDAAITPRAAKVEESKSDLVSTQISRNNTTAARNNIDESNNSMTNNSNNVDAFSHQIGKLINSPYFSATKGAPNYVLDTCSHMISPDGSIIPLTAQGRHQLLTIVDDLSAQSLRVLAVAYKPFDVDPRAEFDSLDSDAKIEFLTRDSIYVGFVGILDPPRPGIQESIEIAKGAGIKTVMITGDYLLTAISIAKSIGLIPLGTDPTGVARDAKELRLPDSNSNYLTDTQIDDLTSSTLVFARATPEDKLVIVRSLQRLGHIVAMTGDGGNDGE
jgi:Ca2+-transporting ATPase